MKSSPDKQKPDKFGFFAAVSTAAIQSNQITKIDINDQPIILTRWQDAIVAFSARCPHASADLSEGELYRGKIECPDHGYVFSVENGRVLYPPDEVCRLRRFEVMEVDGLVKIKL